MGRLAQREWLPMGRTLAEGGSNAGFVAVQHGCRKNPAGHAPFFAAKIVGKSVYTFSQSKHPWAEVIFLDNRKGLWYDNRKFN